MTAPELDSSFPYNTSPGAANGVPGTPNSAQKDPKGALSYESFSDTPTEEWGVYATNFGFKNDFKLYVMYQPPDSGNGVNWVPLDVYSWEFAANITRPSILSTTWTPNPAGMVEDLGKSKSPDYPTWSSKYAP